MSEFAWESFTGAFTGEIEFDFAQPNSPAMVAERIDGFSRNLNDMTEPLVAARQVISDNIRSHFETETDPQGQPWRPWAESYVDRAETENVGILRKTEDLFEAVTDPSAFPIIGDDLWVSTNDFPDYWAVHNYGSEDGRIPKREYLSPDEETMIEVVDLFDRWIDAEIAINLNPLTGMAQFRNSGRIGGRIGAGTIPRSRFVKPSGK